MTRNDGARAIVGADQLREQGDGRLRPSRHAHAVVRHEQGQVVGIRRKTRSGDCPSGRFTSRRLQVQRQQSLRSASTDGNPQGGLMASFRFARASSWIRTASCGTVCAVVRILGRKAAASGQCLFWLICINPFEDHYVVYACPWRAPPVKRGTLES